MKRAFIGVIGLIAILLVGFAVSCGTTGAGAGRMRAGTYTASSPGYNGSLTVEVRLSATAIEAVRVTDSVDSPGVSDWAIEIIPQRIIENQSVLVDVVAGVTLTSFAIMNSVTDTLRQAGANMAQFTRPTPRQTLPDQTLTADVIIVGGGGAGLAAAVSATEAGASVILIEKMGFLGGNSVVAGGIYNTPNPERQNNVVLGTGVDRLILDALAETPINAEHAALQRTVRNEFEAFRRTGNTLFDSPAWFALQTWVGGDKVGNLSIVKKMADNSLPALHWLMDMGMEFYPGVVQGAGSLYPRTHRGLLPNGLGFIKAFRDTLAGSGNYTEMLDTRGVSLIVENGRVVGVNAEGRAGNKVTLRANRGVILTTGGFAGNVELRRQYAEGEKWPYLGPTLLTSNVPGVTGDGIFMARDVGAMLVNMEHIQLLQTCSAVNGAVGGNAYPHFVGGYVFINKNGERFVNEGGRRDDVSQAMLRQPESYSYLIQSADAINDPQTVLTLDGRTVSYMLDNNLVGWVTAPDLDSLARTLNMPAANLRASIDTFNRHVRTQERDEFGRNLFLFEFTNGPWYAFPVKPALHHTMGGVLVDADKRALRADGSVIPGLYCAGEITGVIHGANRLGGNAIVDFTVFGRIAGISAAERR